MTVIYQLDVDGTSSAQGWFSRSPDGTLQPSYVNTPEKKFDEKNIQVSIPNMGFNWSRYNTRVLTKGIVGNVTRIADIPGIFDVVPDNEKLPADDVDPNPGNGE